MIVITLRISNIFGTLVEGGKKVYNEIEKTNIEYQEDLSEKVNDRLHGWVGTVEKQKDLIIDSEVSLDSNNSITVLARGKLAEEDILRHLNAAGVASKYIIGEVSADFIDETDKPDVITSDRQKINESSEEFTLLKDELQKVVKIIQTKWTDLRNETAIKKIQNIPSLNEWYESFKPDTKKIAKKMLGQIENLGLDNPSNKIDLYTYGMFAFQSLEARGKLDLLEDDHNDIETIITLFKDIDEIERAQYTDIVKKRLSVLNQFESYIDSNELEKIIQELLFDHLWLINPGWERATIADKEKERTVKLFLEEPSVVDEEVAKSRFDIQICDIANKWDDCRTKKI